MPKMFVRRLLLLPRIRQQHRPHVGGPRDPLRFQVNLRLVGLGRHATMLRFWLNSEGRRLRELLVGSDQRQPSQQCELEYHGMSVHHEWGPVEHWCVRELQSRANEMTGFATIQ